MFITRNRASGIREDSRSNETSNVSYSAACISQHHNHNGSLNLVPTSDNSSSAIHHSQKSSSHYVSSQDGWDGNFSRSEAFSYSRSRTSLSQSSLPSAENVVLRELLGGLNIACVPTEARVLSLRKLLRELNEQPLPDYDFELLHGALNIVYQKLAVALCTNPTDEELRLSCNVIEKLHNASELAIESTYNDVGFESLPLLISVLQMPFLDNYHTDDGRSRHRPVLSHGLNIITNENDTTVQMHSGRRASEALKDAVQSICMTLLCYSTIDSGRTSMAHVPGLLLTLVWIMNKFHSMPNAARCASITVMSNLSEVHGNRQIMLRTPRLLNEIKRLTSNDENDLIKSNASITLRHLENPTLYDDHPSTLISGDQRPAMGQVSLRSFACNDRFGSVSKESSLSSINRMSPVPSQVGTTERIDEIPRQSVLSSAGSLQHRNFADLQPSVSSGKADNVPSQFSVNSDDAGQGEPSPQLLHTSGRPLSFSGPSHRPPYPTSSERNSETFLAQASFQALNLGHGIPVSQSPTLPSQVSDVSNRHIPEGLLDRKPGTFIPQPHLNSANQSIDQIPLYTGYQGRSSRVLSPTGTSFRTGENDQGTTSQQPAYPANSELNSETLLAPSSFHALNLGRRMPAPLSPSSTPQYSSVSTRNINEGLRDRQAGIFPFKSHLNTVNTEQIPLYSSSQVRSSRILSPTGTSFRTRENSQGITSQQPTSTAGTNQSTEQIPLHPGNRGRSSRFFSAGTSFRTREYNQGLTSQQPIHPVDQSSPTGVSSQRPCTDATQEVNAKMQFPQSNRDTQNQSYKGVQESQPSTQAVNQRPSYSYSYPSSRSVHFSDTSLQEEKTQAAQFTSRIPQNSNVGFGGRNLYPSSARQVSSRLGPVPSSSGLL